MIEYGKVKLVKSKWNTYPRVVHWIHPSHILTYTRGFTSAAVDATHLAHCEYPTVSCCLAFRESSRDEKWYHSSILLLIIVCAAALWRALFPVLTRAAAIDWMVSCNILLFYLLFNSIFVSISPFLTKLCRFYYGKVGGSPAVYAPIERWCSPIIIKLKKNALLRKKRTWKRLGVSCCCCCLVPQFSRRCSWFYYVLFIAVYDYRFDVEEKPWVCNRLSFDYSAYVARLAGISLYSITSRSCPRKGPNQRN